MAVPKLRFKADDGSEFPEWEEMEIGEITGPISSGNSKNEIGSATLYGSMGVIGTCKEATYVGCKILVARVGANAGTLQYVVEDCGVSDNTLVIKETGKVDFLWLFYCLTVINIGRMRFGGGQPLVTGKMIEKKKISIPSLPEQRKIASFLSTIDEIIQSTESELTAWQERKKGVMQKIFNREVRFKADDGSEFPEWEEKRLGELGYFIRGLSYNKTQVLDDGSDASGTAVLRSNNINSDGTLDYRDDVQLVSKEPSSEQQLCENDVVICMANGSNRLVGKAARYDGGYDARRITVGAFCGIFRTDSPLVPWWFQSDDYKSFLHLSKQGGDGALANLKGKDIEAISLLFPSSSTEQRKIADCLSSLDDVINQIKAELSAWKEFKKGLLQQMFV